MELGTGKNANRLGNFIVDVDGVKVNVGEGITDKQRDEFWQNKNKLIGKIIEVKFQEKTPDGSLRFPRFVRHRMDKE
jgi:ATP-dependent DNA ligase